MRRPHTTVRLSEEAKRLLTWLSERTGLSRTGVLELAIRYLAKREKR